MATWKKCHDCGGRMYWHGFHFTPNGGKATYYKCKKCHRIATFTK